MWCNFYIISSICSSYCKVSLSDQQMQTSELWGLRVVLNIVHRKLFGVLHLWIYVGLLLNMAHDVTCHGKRQNEVKEKWTLLKWAGCCYRVYFQMKLVAIVSGNFRSNITDDASDAWNDTVFEFNFSLILHRYKRGLQLRGSGGSGQWSYSLEGIFTAQRRSPEYTGLSEKWWQTPGCTQCHQAQFKWS